MAAEKNLANFLSSQTLLIQQMQRDYTTESEKNAECLRLIGNSLVGLSDKISEQTSTTSNLQSQITAPTNAASANAFLTQSIPWPQPLEVDSGDIYDNFELFKSNWTIYCSATGIDSWDTDQEPRKVNILLSIIGDRAKKKYANFHLSNEDKASAENVLKVIQQRLVSERNLLFDRYTFHTCNQLEDESFDTY